MRRFWAGAVFALILLPGAGGAMPTPQERELGIKAYEAMVADHEILSDAPEAIPLAPIVARLKAVADPLEGLPFTFYIHRSMVPNAFTVDGPRVYVDRGLVDFVDDREELAGVLCHEMSHMLHHDGMTRAALLAAYDERVKIVQTDFAKMTGGHFVNAAGKIVSVGDTLMLLHHSRVQEERADLAGAQLCAQAGFNPWGLTWLFRKFERTYPGSSAFVFLSDHPDPKARIAALKRAAKNDPATFAAWNDDEKHDATPLGTP